MQRIQKTLNWAIVASEFSHVFCCVLPTLFSFATFLVTFGMLSALPVFMVQMHEALHSWEIPLIVFSAVMLGVGWGLHAYSARIDCHNTGCCHEPCKPTKTRTSRVLKIASIVFLLNVGIYLAFHYGGAGLLFESSQQDAPVHDHHHGH